MRVVQYCRRPGRGHHSVERLYDDVRAHMGSEIDIATCVSRYGSRGLFRRLYDLIRARFHQGDVNHVTGDIHFVTYLLDRRRTILTILDCVTLRRLRGVRRWIHWLLWYWLPVKRSAAIVAISESTRQQILKHVRCHPRKVRVIHCAVSDEFQPAPRYDVRERPYILHVGTSKTKNLERHAVALRGMECVLVVIGHLSPHQIDALDRNQIEYENHVDLSRHAVLEQYLRCDLLLFASTYEGFGLPIVEAQAVGRPVITSDLWSMGEVAGDAAYLVDPFDVRSIREGVRRVIEDDAVRARLIERGFENVKRFELSSIAARYAALYHEIHEASA